MKKETYHPGAIITDYFVTVTKVETTKTVVKVRAASQPEALAIGKRFAQDPQTYFGPVVKVDYASKIENQNLSRAEFDSIVAGQEDGS